MGNFHSSSIPVPDEEEGAYPNVQNEYKSNGDSSEASLKPLSAPPPLNCSSRTSDDPSSHSSFSITHGSLTDEEADDQLANAPDNEIVEESVGIIKSREEEREEVVKRSSVVVEKQIPLLQSQDPLVEPLLAPPPPICSPSSHSIFKITHGSLTDEEADGQLANAPDQIRWLNEIVEKTVGITKSREEEREVVKRIIKKQKKIIKKQEKIIKSREEEREGEVMKRSIVVPVVKKSIVVKKVPVVKKSTVVPVVKKSTVVKKVPVVKKSIVVPVVKKSIVVPVVKKSTVVKKVPVVKKSTVVPVVKKSIVVPVVKKSTVVVETQKIIKHYSSHHEILLVGEGDFSFSASLAVAFGSSAPKITATSLDSKAFLKKNYGNAMSNIAELRRRGSKVMHGIDATQIANHQVLGQLKFDRIIFNFPDAGPFHNQSKESQLRCHRQLVSQFLMNAKKMISENGEIHVTHKTNGFHAKFMVESIASSHGLKLIEAVKFNRSDYPGYNTKCGFGGDNNFNCNPSQTYKFGLKTKIIKHYSSRHKILLVGEGDFSFSACLAVAFGSAANITATSLDSKAFLKNNYGNAMSNIAELSRRGSKVMHEIDATQIANHQVLGLLKFDRIIFNFPYAGLFHNLSKESQLRRHRKLVSQFLMNAKKMISENGEIHITQKTSGFYAEFMVESIASSHGLKLIEAVEFNRSDYPGYNTKCGFGGDNNFNCNSSQTYKFGLKTAAMMNGEDNQRWIKYYSSAHNILLVGDGDFSFSLCLGLSFGSATNIVATSLDTHDALLRKFKSANDNLVILKILGATVLHGVDATRMMTHPKLQCKKFHRIIFNFPHAGFHGNEANPAIVMMHRELVHGFLQNASSMLDFDGEIHVPHKTAAPFDSWKIEDLGSECGLVCIAQDEFRIQDYPVYNNKRGASPRADKPFPLGACRTYRFRLAVNNLIMRKKHHRL